MGLLGLIRIQLTNCFYSIKRWGTSDIFHLMLYKLDFLNINFEARSIHSHKGKPYRDGNYESTL